MVKKNQRFEQTVEIHIKHQDNNRKRNQYHPAFCAAMELEFIEDQGHLDYKREYNLNSMPNEIDMVIINSEEAYGVKNILES